MRARITSYNVCYTKLLRLLIRELWDKLREYEDRLAASSRNSSRSPSSDSPQAKAERKKLQRLVAEIRLALNLDTRGTDGR